MNLYLMLLCTLTLFAAIVQLDRDGSGSISAEELGAMMRGLGQNPSEEELQELIDSVDEGEKDGQIQLREFIKLYTMSLDNKNATSNTEVNDCFATFGGDPRDKASKITSAAVRVAPTSLLLCFFLCVISLLLTPPPTLRNFPTRQVADKLLSDYDLDLPLDELFNAKELTRGDFEGLLLGKTRIAG